MPSPFKQNQYRLGLVLGFGALLWNGTYNALAKGLTPFLSPMSLLILSEALTAAFIVMTFGLVPLLKELRTLDAQSIRMSMVVGLFNSVAAPLLWFTGLAHTSAINASILSAADIIAILIVSAMLLRENVTRMQMLGAGVVVTGIVMINVAAPGTAIGVHIGDLFILAGTSVFGIGSVIFKKYLSHMMPELSILIRNITGIVVVSVLSVFVQQSFVHEVAAFPLEQVLPLMAFAFFSRYLNLTFFYEALDRIPVTILSLIQDASPLTGLFFAALLLGEQIHSYQLLGGIVIMLGLLIEQLSKQSLSTFTSRMHSFRFPFHARTSIDGNVAMMPKNI